MVGGEGEFRCTTGSMPCLLPYYRAVHVLPETRDDSLSGVVETECAQRCRGRCERHDHHLHAATRPIRPMRCARCVRVHHQLQCCGVEAALRIAVRGCCRVGVRHVVDHIPHKLPPEPTGASNGLNGVAPTAVPAGRQSRGPNGSERSGGVRSWHAVPQGPREGRAVDRPPGVRRHSGQRGRVRSLPWVERVSPHCRGRGRCSRHPTCLPVPAGIPCTL
jgi:hypothetical protein